MTKSKTSSSRRIKLIRLRTRARQVYKQRQINQELRTCPVCENELVVRTKIKRRAWLTYNEIEYDDVDEAYEYGYFKERKLYEYYIEATIICKHCGYKASTVVGAFDSESIAKTYVVDVVEALRLAVAGYDVRFERREDGDIYIVVSSKNSNEDGSEQNESES